MRQLSAGVVPRALLQAELRGEEEGSRSSTHSQVKMIFFIFSPLNEDDDGSAIQGEALGAGWVDLARDRCLHNLHHLGNNFALRMLHKIKVVYRPATYPD